jgi:crotonobetainyl-CoA:carnitine CoA-transferase CaiB-like acyl-CoA transferase
MTGVYATTAILAALIERGRTGRGRHIDAALLDVQVAMLANQASNHLVGGIVPRRLGNAHPNIVPYQVFATQDGHVVLAVGNDGQFARLCELAGDAALASDPRYASNAARVAHRGELVALIGGWMRQRSTRQWVDLLEPNAVPCAPILDLAGVFRHPQVVARGMRAEVPAGRRMLPLVANPMRFDGERAMSDQPPPTLDEQGSALRAALARATAWPAREAG